MMHQLAGCGPLHQEMKPCLLTVLKSKALEEANRGIEGFHIDSNRLRSPGRLVQDLPQHKRTNAGIAMLRQHRNVEDVQSFCLPVHIQPSCWDASNAD